MALKHLGDIDHDCACRPGSTPHLPPAKACPAQGSRWISNSRAQWVRRNEWAPSSRVSEEPPPGPRALLPDCSAPNHSSFRVGGSAFTSLPPFPPVRASARARASRSGSSSDKAWSAAGPGVRGASVRRVAGRGGAQEAGADQRGRTEPAGPTVTGPSPPLPSPPRPPSLRSLFPYAGSGSLPEARGALPRAPRVSLPPRGGRGSGAVGRYRYYPFPETSKSRGRGRLGIP